MENKEQTIKYLTASKERLIKHIKNVIKSNSFNYKTFGTEIEDYVLDEIIAILKDGGFIKKESDYKKAQNKNQFPEIEIYTQPTIAVDVKSGNHSKKTGNTWVKCKN